MSFPVWLRLTHFVNLLFMTLLIRSGIQILFAHPKLYWRDDCLPGSEWLKFTRKQMPRDRLWTSMDEEEPAPSGLALPGGRTLGLGRHWHYVSVLGWVLSGGLYVTLLLTTGEWRRLIPTSWAVFPEAWHAFVTYLHFQLPPETGHYNALQQLSYAGVVFVLAPLQILTGAALSPAIDARHPWYPRLFGSRQGARSLHFIGLGLFCVFLVIHVTEVVLHGFGREMSKIVLGSEQASRAGTYAATAVGLGLVLLVNVWATRASRADPTGTQKRLGRIFYPVRAFFLGRLASRQHLTPADISPYFRVNGRPPTGAEYQQHLTERFAGWRLNVKGLVRKSLSLRLEDLHALRRVRQITRHDCIQGWSAVAEWTGLPLSELIALCEPHPEARFVVFHAFAQDEHPVPYYGSLPMEQALHPQTILAYEMNGQPLPPEHGAPLRLRVETQLGFKMVKYLHAIEFVESLEHVGKGLGGLREDYQQYGTEAGI
ncbi:molybdopterin-dependent oxidoreductase [Melittangium boletus]|uniref:molybdopterin-dependent oxidoreductase n=1 Tax=Melittangium boletus TaxID=83453 RepID=UPI003DA2896A